MKYLEKIKKPTLLLDENICRNNIRRMARKASDSGVIFRPHFKTHQSIEIGRWFREEGVEKITASSVTMAGHFARNGWNDITIAFPFNIREADDVRSLMKVADINILVTDHTHIEFIESATGLSTGCFVKINTGNNRSGTDWDDKAELERIAGTFRKAKHLRLKGILTHAGHSYKSSSREEIERISAETVSRLRTAAQSFNSTDLTISSGDTPGCSVIEKFEGLDEIRPGNFVFYDLMQVQLGSCTPGQVAVAVACPVVEKNNRKKEVIIYGGGVHLSKDSLKLKDGRTVYGQVVYLTDNGWVFPEKDTYLRSISQEHGIIDAEGEVFDNLERGGLVGILPVHSCMTADVLREYHLPNGKVISDFSPK